MTHIEIMKFCQNHCSLVLDRVNRKRFEWLHRYAQICVECTGLCAVQGSVHLLGVVLGN
jgi:hypothetical protein